LLAQNSAEVDLKEVQISSSKITYNSGLQQTSFDTTVLSGYKNSSLSELLYDNSAISLKQYGPGQLTTVSLRGGSAYHTTLLWNGFLLTSPLNGLRDLSLEKNFFFEDISTTVGGTSYLWGSGAVSGSIHLNNNPSFNSGLGFTAGLNAGSYSNLNEYASISYGSKKYYGTLKFYHSKGKNNFQYYNPSTDVKTEQVNSGCNYYGIMNENYFVTGKNSILNFRIWHSESDREIPPPMDLQNTHANQKDRNTRVSAEWKQTGEKYNLNFKSAFFVENIYYTDDLQPEPADNTGTEIINEATVERIFLGKHFIQAGANYTASLADSSTTIPKTSLNRFSLFALYRYVSENGKLDVSASTRYEFSTLFSSPVIVSGGTNYKILTPLLLRIAASTVFRNPTINDLYWVPGGNIDLKPENGYSIESGFSIDVLEALNKNKNTNASTLFVQATVYYKNINDWIIWYPSTSLFWSPQNLLEVESKGIETEAEFGFKKSSFSAKFNVDYNYTLSTNEKTSSPNDASLHKQLIYVPMHRLAGSLYFGYKNFNLQFYHSFTGLRYTSSDNSQYLDPYSIDNLMLEKLFPGKKNSFKAFIRINNIFNTDYQSVQNRPMPLRTYEGGIAISHSGK
jgi:iron complex outermembrane receptor protein